LQIPTNREEIDEKAEEAKSENEEKLCSSKEVIMKEENVKYTANYADTVFWKVPEYHDIDDLLEDYQ